MYSGICDTSRHRILAPKLQGVGWEKKIYMHNLESAVGLKPLRPSMQPSFMVLLFVLWFCQYNVHGKGNL